MRCDWAWFCACLRLQWRCTFGCNVSLPCALGSAVKFYGVRFNLNYCWVAKWLRGYFPVGGFLCLFPRFSGLWENFPEYILRVRDFVWFNVEISSRYLRECQARISWERVSEVRRLWLLQLLPGQWHSRPSVGSCTFEKMASCFMCQYSIAGIERTRNKSQNTKLSLESHQHPEPRSVTTHTLDPAMLAHTLLQNEHSVLVLA